MTWLRSIDFLPPGCIASGGGLACCIDAAAGLTGESLITFRTTYGNCVALNPYSYIDRIVLESGYYESEIIEAIRPHLGPGAVFWDIGANIGLHAVTAKFLSPETRVIAFEPNPAMLPRLSRNQALSSVDVEVCAMVLGADRRCATLHLSGEGNPGMSTLKPWDQAGYEAVLNVYCDRVDRLVSTGSLPEPTVVKIDVEGFEMEVLEGFGDLLARPTLRILVFEAEAGAERPESNNAIARLLRSAGFQLRPLARREATEHNLENYAAERLPHV